MESVFGSGSIGIIENTYLFSIFTDIICKPMKIGCADGVLTPESCSYGLISK